MNSNNWSEQFIEDVIEINPKYSLKKNSFAKKIAMADIEPFTRKIQNYEMTEYNGGGSKFKNGDTLLARITPCLENGKTSYTDILDEEEIAFGSTEFIVLRGKSEQTLNKFVYYLAISPEFRNIAIKSMTGTSGRQRAQKSVIEKTKIKVPPIEQQEFIVNTLSSLEDKIELNHSINKSLEEIAQTLFHHWFDEFEFLDKIDKPFKSNGGEFSESEAGLIPSGWEVKKLQEVASCQNGYAFYKQGYALNGFKVVDLGNVNIYGEFVETSRDKYVHFEVGKRDTMRKFLLEKDDLVMVMTDRTQDMNILGKTGVIYENSKFILNQRMFRIRANQGVNVNYLKSVLNSKRILNKLKSQALGTAQKYVNTGQILELDILIPTKDIMEKYSTIVNPIFEAIRKHNEEILLLEEIRDLLLPKLLSGKITCPIE
jgi:type I restriction enzyme, S subunit